MSPTIYSRVGQRGRCEHGKQRRATKPTSMVDYERGKRRQLERSTRAPRIDSAWFCFEVFHAHADAEQLDDEGWRRETTESVSLSSPGSCVPMVA